MHERVKDLDSVRQAIKTLNDSLPRYRELANRLGRARAFYALDDKTKPRFGFSRFIGYEGLTPEDYLNDYNSLDRNTEHALATWFMELGRNTQDYDALLRHLTVWLARYGKRPFGGKTPKVRLMVLRPQYRK